MNSPGFRSGVLSKTEFTRHLRAVCIDEAHCISLWGGSFRPDYASLGNLRAKLPPHVTVAAALATFPNHILEDIRKQLDLSNNAATVSLSNDRPNVALSVRAMEHSEDSKGDLRFLLPKGVRSAADIPVTAIYCNERLTTEDISDQLHRWAEDEGLSNPEDFIVYYHAKISASDKRDIEERLRRGEVRIIVCTDAVGMVCLCLVGAM